MTEDVRRFIGPPIRSMLSAITRGTGIEALHELEVAFRRSYDSDGWSKTMLQPAAKETLAWLAGSRRRAFVFTNKPRNATTRILENFQISGAFFRILCRDAETHANCSKAEMLRSLMQVDGVAVDNSIVVGDTEEDLEAAREVGMTAAILTNGYGDLPRLPARPRCFMLQGLDELPSLFAIIEGADPKLRVDMFRSVS